MMAEEWQNAPPVDVIKDSLEEAHRLQESNALEAASYLKWLATFGHKSQGVTLGEEEQEEDLDYDNSDAGDTEDEEEEHERGGRSAGNIDTSDGEDGDAEEERLREGRTLGWKHRHQ